MITKILAAYDGSEDIETEGRALRGRRRSAWPSPAQTDRRGLPAVASPPEPPEAVLEYAEAHYKELFDALKAEAANQGLNPRFEVVAGHPANQIVYRAEQDGVDLIVVGHRGKGFFERLLVGSVSKQVVTHAYCPVLVVR